MQGRKTEMPHNTPEQVREYLSAALELTEDLDPPADLRTAVFVKAADLFAAKQITVEQVVPGIPGMAIPRG